MRSAGGTGVSRHAHLLAPDQADHPAPAPACGPAPGGRKVAFVHHHFSARRQPPFFALHETPPAPLGDPTLSLIHSHNIIMPIDHVEH
jgi:hypothetical protein